MSLFSLCSSDNAVAYFKLDEIIGTTPANATDSLGAGFTNIFYQGNIVTGQTPLAYNDINSKAPSFDGINDNITMTTPGAYTDNFTIEIWAEFYAFQANHTLWSGWNANSSGNYGSGLYVNDAGVLQVELARTTFNSFEVQANTGYALQLNTVYHIALTTDNSTKTAKLYINGVEVWSRVYTNNVGLFNNAKTFRIGSRGQADWVWAKLDEMAIYHGTGIAPLTQTQIASHYAAGLVTTITTDVGNVNLRSHTQDYVAQITGGLPGTPFLSKPISDTTYDPNYASRWATRSHTLTSTSGPPHIQSIDETTADLNDYIRWSGTVDTGQSNQMYSAWTFDPPPNDPLTAHGHVVKAAIRGTWSAQFPPAVGFYVYSGTTFLGTIQSLVKNIAGNNELVYLNWTLNTTITNAISNYNAVSLLPFLVNNTGSARSFQIDWYWVQIEFPDWQGIGGVATKTNTNINGQSVTVEAIKNVEISQEETTIHTVGHDAEILIFKNISIDITSTNISVNGQEIEFSATGSVELFSSPTVVTIQGHSVSIATGISFLTIPEPGNITLDAKDVELIESTVITTIKTNIGIDAKDISSSYYQTIIEDSPTHWWRFNDRGNWAFDLNYDATITDIGLTPVNGTSRIPDKNSFQNGVPGAWNDGFDALLTQVNSNTVIRFPNNNAIPISDEPNMTVEFWIYWNSFSFVNEYILTNNAFNFGNVSVSRRGIGINQGRLTYTRSSTVSGQNSFTTMSVTDALSRSTWHHIVLTKSTVSGTSTYKSYVDGNLTLAPLSLGDWFGDGNNIDFQSMVGFVDSSNGFDNSYRDGQCWIDEIAVYNTALSLNQVQNHYSAGRLGPINVTINSEVTNIMFYTPAIGISDSINITTSNINIQFRNAIVDAGGSTLIITNAPNIQVDGIDATSVTGGSINRTIEVQRTTIDINGTSAKISTRETEFIFISKSDTSLSAADAEEISNINFGGLLFNQIKKEIFKIGNVSDYISRFELFAYSADQDVSSAVSLSKDNITYSSTIVFEEILPNQITDNIYIKFDVNQLEELGIGTFLIRVEQTDVS